MGLFGKIFKVTAKGADELFTSKPFRKGTAKAAQKATQAVSSFTNKGTIKTTAAIANQGVSTATAGGRKVLAKVASDTAKGAGTTARIGGKVLAGTGIAAIPALTGIGLYNSYKNSTALTDEDRRVEFLIDMQDKANKVGQGIADNSTGDPAVDANPQAVGNTGVGGNSSFNPFSEAYGGDSDEEQSSGSSLGLIAGVAAAAAGGYYIYKKSKKGKK